MCCHLPAFNDSMLDKQHTDDIAFFIAFCVEKYKNTHSLSGEAVSDVFSKHGLMEYLADNYEILHTQSPQWIIAEIDDIITNHSI